jgi:hypothetical protein
MYARMFGAAAALAAVACAPGTERPERLVLEHGRQYTTWLYGNQYDKLWDRFSPEMRQTFGSVGELATFASRAVTRMGREQGAVDERVERTEPFGVYSRTASFDNAPKRMRIEWSLTDDGEVTGLLLRPATESGQ